MKRVAILLVLITALSRFGPAADTVTRRYPVLKLGTLILQVPGHWKAMEPEILRDNQYRILFVSDLSRVRVNYYWNLTQISNLTVDEIARTRLLRVGKSLLSRAKENELEIKRWSDGNSFVLYFTLTDRRRDEKLKFLTHGTTTRGNLVLMVTVLTPHRTDPAVTRALTMLTGAVFDMKKEPARK